MRLSMETLNLGLSYGIREALRLMKEAGFDAADLTLDKINPDDDLLHRPDMREFAVSLREYADGLGIAFAQAHAPFKVVYGDAFDTSCPAYDDIVRALELCGILGIPQVVVHAIKTPREDITVDYKEYNRRYYLSLLPYCEKFGVKIAVENLFTRDVRNKTYYGLFPDPRIMTEFVTSLGSPYFAVCCDLGHTAVTGLAPENYIRGMSSDLLCSLHVQDTDFRGDRHMPPYMGSHNWDEICRALAEINYSGDFSLELPRYTERFPDELLPAAMEIACRTGRFLISRIEKEKAALGNA